MRQPLTLHTVKKQSEWDELSDLNAHFSDPLPTARPYLPKGDPSPTTPPGGPSLHTQIITVLA